MLRTSSGKISYAGLGCPKCWFSIIDNNLTMHFSKTSMNTSGFKIITPHPPIRKQMVIKTRLEGAKGVWPNELPGVLWAYRMTVRTPTGETPFKLAYGSEAFITVEVHMANHRVMTYQVKDNEEQLRLCHDLIDEVRMDAEHRIVRYKTLMARQHDAMVSPRRFNIGDFVLKRVSLATKNPAQGKLGPNWEEPYKFINCKRQGSYYLETLDRRKLEHLWNVEHLRRYYQ